MSAIEKLHPALRYHIVNSLGWKEMRGFQERTIPAVLEGKHCLVLAPTAGGKTEAAVIPLLSRMLEEDWTGLSLLYVCPIKALLNNLEARLSRYCTLVGRCASLWHGDIARSQKRQTLLNPPDCLLTTPESLEGMLISSSVDAQRVFGGVQAVVIDEIHAFAGDDRGWHLLSVLERLGTLVEGEPQRIGLSATVGNPDVLLNWLSGHCESSRWAHVPTQRGHADAEVMIDYVATLENAATVISRLHRGEKRLVFVDSRSRAERLATLLRENDTQVFVSHSSLGIEQRKASEEAFATRRDCVIVATSALELGIDIGDLDRVIQVDCPFTVSSFLQRMGRTGRREDTQRNCLFLTTSDEALVQATGLVRLWSTGFVEDVLPPPKPYRVVAQQLLALVIQQKRLTRNGWRAWLLRILPAMGIADLEVELIIDYMLNENILVESDGLLWLGDKGEKLFEKKNYLELLSVFTSPPYVTVLHGRHEIGFLDLLSFAQRSDGPLVVSLAGRPWNVIHIDWKRKVAQVEPSEFRGRSLWSGQTRSMGGELSGAMRDVLSKSVDSEKLSKRAKERIDSLREDFKSLSQDDSTVVAKVEEGHWVWWTFAGTSANLALQVALQAEGVDCRSTATKIQFEWCGTWEDLKTLLQACEWENLGAAFLVQDDGGAKFSECVPKDMARRSFFARNLDTRRAKDIATAKTVVHHLLV